jgi:hypothetical protein
MATQIKPKTRICSVCKKRKALTAANFYPMKRGMYGHHARCSTCARKYQKRYDRDKTPSVPVGPTPQQLLEKHYPSQTAMALAAGCRRQAISVAFARGRLSFQLATIFATLLKIKVDRLLVQWHPNTIRRAKASPHVVRRLRAVQGVAKQTQKGAP